LVAESLNAILAASLLLAAPRGEGEGYVKLIESPAQMERFSKTSALPVVERFTKFLIPVRAGEPDLLPSLFQNVNHYPLHIEFLKGEFPERFSGMSLEEYSALVERRRTRGYYAGVLFQFKGEAPSYGFEIFTASDDAGEALRPEEALRVHQELLSVFKLAPVAYSPKEREALRIAAEWREPGFPVNLIFGSDIATYIPYTRAENYGRVKVLSQSAFDALNRSGAFSFQDILVLEAAPRDIEGVIAGVITGGIQSELDHLAIRTARRGTPNAFVREPLEKFRPFDGKLVRLKIGASGYEVDDRATLQDAEAWWDSHRPDLGSPPAVEADYRRLDDVEDIAADGSVGLVSRYGGKGSNFARLFHLLPEEHRVPGFMVPFAYYLEFIDSSQVPSFLDSARQISIRDYIAEMLADADFKGNSTRRFAELARLQDLIRGAAVSPGVVRSIALKVVRVFGTGKRPARFRSSSNAEDQLEFNGAGLYSSTSACASDDLDVDDDGPSQCDAADDEEDGIAGALKLVWASLWNFRAFEEREYYRIPHLETHMAVLVSEAFPDELANGVAFTGNPDAADDKRFIINVQVGDVPVVFTDPGITTEKDILVVENGVVGQILRQRRSNLAPENQYVLSDEQLRLMGAVMASVESRYPFDLGSHKREQVLLDFEFKIDRQNQLRFKQVRPFLIAATAEPAPEYQIRVPEGLTLCGGFAENKDLLAVLRQKIVVGLRAGDHVLSAAGSSAANIFEWTQFTDGGPRLEPLGPGVWSAVFEDRSASSQGKGYAFSAKQQFNNGNVLVDVSIEHMYLRLDGPEVTELDPLALTLAINPYLLYSEARFCDAPLFCHAPFNPCDMRHLPEYTVDVELEDGSTAHFEERFQILEEGTGPAELKRAVVDLRGEERVIDDYFHLAYTAGHHNDQPPPTFWAVFEPPIELDGVGSVGVLEVAQNYEAEGPTARLLDANFNELTPMGVVGFTRLREGINPLIFRRGDVDLSGKVNLTDAVKLLTHLFDGGAPLPCSDAADADDLGTVEITDAVIILGYLFLGDDPPADPGPTDCGFDVEPDELSICNSPGCE
jgi:hypothetical protein